MGYYLAQEGRRFVIFERADSVAPVWHERWDSLKLFTPRGYSALPGLPFPGDPDDYPTRDEVIAYLEQYAETFELPIEINSKVRRVSREEGRFALEVDGRTITADQVVVATGPFQTPYIHPGACLRRLAGPQHALPAAQRGTRRDRARGRGRKHRLSDR
jgi:putative flavoprotein involved in K+ transport